MAEKHSPIAYRRHHHLSLIVLPHTLTHLHTHTDTAVSEIEDCFKRFLKRDDIDIILINQNYAELIRHVIDAHTSPLPAVLEIPSKDHPYDASKDSILRRAKVSVLGLL